MALFLDSADIKDVRLASELGFVAGVTTNPSLVAKTGRPAVTVIQDILEITTGPVFFQVTAETVGGRAEQARSAFKSAPERLIVKIPATTENLSLAARLKEEGIACAITAVSSPSQTYLATLAEASYVAIYVNRLTRQMGDGIAVLRDSVAITQRTSTRVLAASLKSVDEVVAAILTGAHDITIPLDLILKLGEHELSQKAIEEFSRNAPISS